MIPHVFTMQKAKDTAMAVGGALGCHRYLLLEKQLKYDTPFS